MKDRKTYEKISAAIKAGDKAATRKAIQEMNAKTTRKREQYKAGTWW
jgi:DNA-binding FadR family transcriptional regulator